MTELKTIITNIKAAVVKREIKLCEAAEILGAILDHELEAKLDEIAERKMTIPERIAAYYGE